MRVLRGAEQRVVYAVDHDADALHSLMVLLRSNGLTAAGFASAGELLQALPDEARGCLVTELRMPEVDGVQLIQALKSRGCFLPVIVVSGGSDVGLAVDAMKAGAADFMEKPHDNSALLRTVHACMDADAHAYEARCEQIRLVRRLESLTNRERQVLDLILEGASNKHIAARLAISPRTVEIYRAHVMSKMWAESLSELVRMCLLADAAQRGGAWDYGKVRRYSPRHA